MHNVWWVGVVFYYEYGITTIMDTFICIVRVCARNYKLSRNGKLCKETYWAKFFAGTIVPSRSVAMKNITGYSHTHETLELMCFGCSICCGITCWWVLMRCKIWNRLVNARILKTCPTFFSFLRFLPFYFLHVSWLMCRDWCVVTDHSAHSFGRQAQKTHTDH